MGRYRKVEVSMWGDSKFNRLTPLLPSGQALWIYFLTGSHTGYIPGVISAGKATIAESLGWSIDDVSRYFDELEQMGMAMADWDTRVVFLPNGIWHNQPANQNQITGWRKEFDVLPESDIRSEIEDAIRCMFIELDATFVAAGKTAWHISTWNGCVRAMKRSEGGLFSKKESAPTNNSRNGSVTNGRNGSDNGSVTNGRNGSDNGSVTNGRNGLRNGSVNPVIPAHEGSLSLAELALAAQNKYININGLAGNNTTDQSIDGTVPQTVPQTVVGTSSSSSNRISSSNRNNFSLEADASSAVSGQLKADHRPVAQDGDEGDVISVSKTKNTTSTPLLADEAQFELIAPAVDPVFCEIPIAGKPFVHAVTESKVVQYEATYPGIDVRQELRSCRQWDIDNPRRRKTATGVQAHINSWLSKAQNQAGAVGGNFAPERGREVKSELPEELPAGFKRFWNVYPPGRGDQRDAYAAWSAMHRDIDDATLSALIKGVQGWAASDDWSKDSGRYIPNPVKFLREERWRSVPTNRHFGLSSSGTDDDEARFSGKTLREILAIQESERLQASGEQ